MKLVILAALAALLPACIPLTISVGDLTPVSSAAPGVTGRAYTLKEFNRIKQGMTQAEVEKILGRGQVVSQSTSGGIEMVFLQWSNPDGMSNITVGLTNGKVDNVAHFGLK